jgi:hypothetical protein
MILVSQGGTKHELRSLHAFRGIMEVNDGSSMYSSLC